MSIYPPRSQSTPDAHIHQAFKHVRHRLQYHPQGYICNILADLKRRQEITDDTYRRCQYIITTRLQGHFSLGGYCVNKYGTSAHSNYHPTRCAWVEDLINEFNPENLPC